MNFNSFVAIAWVAGLMISPEALTLQGNIVGENGAAFFVAILLAMALHGCNAQIYPLIPTKTNPQSSEVILLQNTFGSLAASILLLISRPVLAVCLGTATLVASGFVFNEVFIYWFPNFGFAVLVMLTLLILNLTGGRIAAVAQVIFVTVAVSGLLVLSVWAMVLWFQTGEIPSREPISFNINSLALAALLFIGYDLLNFTKPAGINYKKTSKMTIGIIVIGLLSILWGLTAYLNVSPERLADTTLPHILTAKKIGGQTGRVIIGMVIIAGTCAAVNVLFHAVSRMMTHMAENRLLPGMFNRFTGRPLLPLFCLAGTIGLLMAMGFAGSELLDKSIRAGSLFWLLGYAMTHLALFMRWHKKRSLNKKSPPPFGPRLHVIVFGAILFSIVGLVLSDDNIAQLLLTMLVIFIISVFLAWICLHLAKSSSAISEHK